jgi:DNA-binding SARP family transcriptional activator/tetratricopeptide (TPR) repeat protein
MWFGLLGPLCIRSDDAELPVPAARHRVLLAALLVQAGHVVPVDALGEAVWDGAPPAGARITLRTYVSRLRQELGPALGGRVLTRSPGYLIEATEDEVDLLRFEALCRSGAAAVRSGSWQQASADLSQVLGLWRGTPLMDIPSQFLQRGQVPRLEDLRVQALEDQFDADLHLGRHHELIADLQHLTDVHPLRERLRALLMLALYRAGRQADALAVFREGHRLLMDELAVEPGTQLRTLHQRILDGDSALEAPGATGAPFGAGAAAAPEGGLAAPRSPRQLPPVTRQFTGRAGDLAALHSLRHQSASPSGAPPIFVISGTAGVGKTALAVCWAHQVAGQFPDGQLYVDLRGFGPSGGPVEPADAIRGFLDAFEVPADQIPPSPEEQAALYRSLLAGQRVMILLDNARDVAQVRPLLAAEASGLFLVTSRGELTGLIAHQGAHLRTLAPLPESEACDLLVKRIGDQRAAGEPGMITQLAQLCAGLPLALNVVAARASTRPGLPLSALAAEFRDRDNRLNAFDDGDMSPSMRAMFAWSYDQLSEQAARLFRLLGVHPGPDITVPAAASTAGIPPDAARRLLAELTRTHLLNEHVPGRFAFHDLLRTYAAERAQEQDDGQECRLARHRALDHYLHTARAADHLLNPARMQPTVSPSGPAVLPERLDDDEQALAWFGAERKVLLAVVRWAADTGSDLHASMLPGTLVTFLDRQGHLGDYAATQRIALAAAARLGDRPGQARAHCDLGGAYGQLGLDRRAHENLSQACRLYRELGDPGGAARVQLTRGWLCNRERRYAQALRHNEDALELFRASDEPLWQARALGGIGWCHTLLGDHLRALTICQQALDLHRQLGDELGEAAAWDSLGGAHHQLGHYQEAVTSFRRSIMLYSELGEHYYHAEAMTRMGDAHEAAGNLEAAHDAWLQAATMLAQLGHPDVEEVRAKIAQLDLKADA